MSITKLYRSFADAVVDVGSSLIVPKGSRENFRKRFRSHKVETIHTPPSVELLTLLKNSRKGQRCVLAGTGPSINQIDLGLITNEFIFTVNRGYMLESRLNRRPNAIMLTDSRAFEEYGHEIMSQRWDYIFLNSNFSKANLHHGDAIFFAKFKRPSMSEGFFQNNCCKPLYTASTVSLQALQMAVWMGFSEIIIIGIDLEFDKSSTHFYSPSKNEISRTHSLSLKNSQKMKDAFDFAADYITKHTQCKIYNASPRGSLNSFPRISWDSLF